MVEEADTNCDRLATDADGGRGGGVEGEDFRVSEWMAGLPSSDDLTPLSQSLVSPELASAFHIPLPDLQTMLDVHRATQNSISNLLRHHNQQPSSSAPTGSLRSISYADAEEIMSFEADDHREYSSSGKVGRRSDQSAGYSTATETTALEDDSSSIHVESSVEENHGRMLKRPRLVWTPQLHKRFADMVARLGIKNAVPKTIVQLMNVDGLTRENVASHLQKYMLYLKRVQGLSDEGPSSSDHLFASTPALRFLQGQELQRKMPVPLPHPVSAMILFAYLYNGFNSHLPFAPDH